MVAVRAGVEVLSLLRRGIVSEEFAFATDPATGAYYHRRAGEYDDWYLGRGRCADRPRPDWGSELDALIALVRDLP